MATYTSHYPPSQDSTYVKSTSQYSADYAPFKATDPTKSLTGTWTGNNFLSGSGQAVDQKFNIDLGEGHIIKRIYYENGGYGDGSVWNNF